tara:strand:+ start:480 stop:1091 length:612 start_codon:yes stop_codon:yes gene_type:complete
MMNDTKFDVGGEFTHKGYTINGWFFPANKRWYEKHATNIKNGIIVEIGVFGGASLLSVADICKDNNTQLYGVDTWELLELKNGDRQTPEQLKIFREGLKAQRLKLEKITNELNYSHITLVKDFSMQAVHRFKDNSIDLIYLDASHDYKNVTQDLKSWFPKLKKNGILGGDDWGWPEVKRAVIDFCKKNNLKPIDKDNHWEIIF